MTNVAGHSFIEDTAFVIYQFTDIICPNTPLFILYFGIVPAKTTRVTRNQLHFAGDDDLLSPLSLQKT